MTKDESKPGFWSRLRARWGVGVLGTIAIIIAFAAAGMTVLKVSRPILRLILPDNPPKWLWWTCRILIIVPVYEVLLLGYGTLLGQRRFFWDKQARLRRFLMRPFVRHSH